MFVYLSKKIAVPKNIKLRCVSYNLLEGFLACGGDDNLLKVLKLDPKIDNPNVRGVAAASNLAMNQALEGHKGPVTVLSWNEKHQKLTSGDQNGLIIVWMLHKGVWYEEMVNNRSKSVVSSMRWNADGAKICIGYEDGTVILGSVDGNRIWGKDLSETRLSHLEWAPNGRLLLFGTANGEVQIADANGDVIGKIAILCQANASARYKVVDIEWYNGSHGYYAPDCPSLAICFDNGRCQLMRGEVDPEPVLLDTGLTIVSAKWNYDGSLLAVAGQKVTETDFSFVYFYNPLGEHMRTLKVTGKNLTCCSWEGGGHRLAMTVDYFIYFAIIRPDYRWAYFADTVVYAFTKPDKAEHCVIFWDTKHNEKRVKYFRNLLSITAFGDFCCILQSSEEPSMQHQFVLLLCNSIGVPLDTKTIDMVPTYVAMTSSHVVVASKEAFYMWQFKNVKQRALIEVSTRSKAGTEKLYHVDDVPSGVGGETIDFSKAAQPTKDPITAVCISEKHLIVARESGSFNLYTMPSLSLTNKFTVRPNAHRLALNSTSTRLAIIDSSSVLTFFNLENAPISGAFSGAGQEVATDLATKLERKDVWDMKWAVDSPDMFAVMEKTRLIIFHGTEPEDPVLSSGYIGQFKDLQVKSVLLDDVMMDPEHEKLENVVITETKSLRDTRALLETGSIDDAVKFVEANSDAPLWRLLAENSLNKLNLKVAEHSFVRCKDFAGIQLVKRLGNMQNDMLKHAEIAAYFGRYDEAEKLYIDLDRKDLAVALRKKLGDWFRVVQLLKTGSFADDQQLEEACNAIGDYYADRQKWQQAVQYYVQGRNQQRLAKCYYMVEDYNGLKMMTDSLPENHQLLEEIADMFVTIGMCKEAVDAYVKCGKIQQAIDACVQLNQWNIAIDLAKTHNVRDTEPLLVKYAETLLDKNKTFDAVELYRKANHHLDAAKLLYQIAEQEAKRRTNPLRAKKLFLLAALLVEQYHEQMRSTHRAKTKKRGAEAVSALAGLLEEDVAAILDTKVIDNAWHGAEAYHFYILAQRQLYDGHLDNALRTCLHLRSYEDVIDPVDIYSLLGLAAAAIRAFGMCSKAFFKLESLESLTPEQHQHYEELAMQIFLKYPPKDAKVIKVECPSCAASIPDTCTVCPGCDTKFPTCIVTGRPLFTSPHWMCSSCKHHAHPTEISARRVCPMCHTRI